MAIGKRSGWKTLIWSPESTGEELAKVRERISLRLSVLSVMGKSWSNIIGGEAFTAFWWGCLSLSESPWASAVLRFGSDHFLVKEGSRHNMKLKSVDRWIIHDRRSLRIEQFFYHFANHVRFASPEGYHHQGMHWSDIVRRVDNGILKLGWKQ